MCMPISGISKIRGVCDVLEEIVRRCFTECEMKVKYVNSGHGSEMKMYLTVNDDDQDPPMRLLKLSQDHDVSNDIEEFVDR